MIDDSLAAWGDRQLTEDEENVFLWLLGLDPALNGLSPAEVAERNPKRWTQLAEQARWAVKAAE